ncbi:MAG: tetratricopeptide repeat protein [Desulfomonile tiedjei]|nr:tetratricopeptide repeat protein [Desulfomonile tiedjei]
MNSSTGNVGSSRTATLLAALVLLGVTVGVYYPCLSHEIIDLDYADWVQAAQPPGLKTLVQIFAYDANKWQHLGYFAPLTAASFMADLLIGAEARDLAAVHLGLNLLIHLLNGLAVLWLLRALRFDLWISFTAACLFSVHPLQVSTICWVAERKNLLASFFFLLGLICYVRCRLTGGRRTAYVGALAACVLSLLSKPTAVVFGPCIVITDWFLIDRKLTKESLLRAAPFLALGIGWTVLATATEHAAPRALPFLDRLLLAPYNILFLAWKFFVPSSLGFIYPPVHVSAGSLAWWLPLLLCFALGGLIYWLHRFAPLWGISWATGFYVLNVMPSAGIIPFGGMRELYVANHYQYLAAVGTALLAALAWTALANLVSVHQGRTGWKEWISGEPLPSRVAGPTAQAIKAASCCAAIGFLAALSFQQAKLWENGEALWRQVIESNPSCYVAHSNYGTYLHVRGRYGEAARQYEEALSIDPNAYKMAYNLGLVAAETGRTAEAIVYFNRALAIDPTLGSAHLALAEIYFVEQNYQVALRHCREATRYGSDCPADEIEMAARRQKPQIGLRKEDPPPARYPGSLQDKL